jgi:hypothetical protein
VANTLDLLTATPCVYRSIAMPSSPGTVSKILWHFPGGPKWDDATKKQEETPKAPEGAYVALLGIISSHELRIGKYKELVHVENPWFQMMGPGSMIIDPRRTIPGIIESSPVNCIADIPIMHLSYHAQRYGTMAIGFHRESVVKHGFSPVAYHLVGSPRLESIHQTYNISNSIAETRRSELELIAAKVRKPNEPHGYMQDATGAIVPVPDPIDHHIEVLTEGMRDLLGFIKSFKQAEFETIYTEREWRSLSPFKFEYADVSMVVLPRGGGYFERFVTEAESIGLPKTVSIVAWEDLVEH